ncbi:MAG: hypothetical protein CMP76_10280 [Flavobacterium sp.]|uniref:hypothetical protein n=1 Tax=Flavobacterium sp. TaxID=239 RepID=UPI000C3D12C6|nr:hypothetical protein [Flavobacterium sp.]MBF03671.1 hypothetical protein [Flavobacterium sp.]|tara:strand:- start:1574 stop:2290 length:717 start_codon:yes stop_codon:yes gene_type:complete
MKTPQDHIEFYKEQEQIFTNGLVYCQNLTEDKLYLSIFNIEQIFICNLMIGLIEWRINQNPKLQLIKAITHFEKELSKLKELEDYKKFQNPFLIITANYFAYLCNQECNLVINPLVTKDEHYNIEYYLFNSISKSSNFKPEIETSFYKINKSKKHKLVFDSYTNYFQILEAFENNENLNNKIEIAESLFTKRANNSYYSNGHEIDGGYLNNNLVIDFRLAVILKKIDYKGNSIHKWNW